MYLNTVFKYNVFKYNVFKYCPALARSDFDKKLAD